MRRIALALSMAFLALSAQTALAQQQTVTGQVTAAETGQPLPGATVQVKNTGVGTITNSEGRYRLQVPEAAEVLVFSSLGYGTVERRIPSGEATVVMNAELVPQAISLEGIVATALGIERQARAVTTSIQEVDGEDITAVPETNVVNALHGQVAGVQITDTGGQIGGSSRIVIRGASSITGDNQPLFVVNGVPIINSDAAVQGIAMGPTGYGQVDWGNSASDINPDNIESITVLKGAAAAALYGSRAANGVILIQTKDGSGVEGTRITASTDVMFSEPLVLPDYQNEFGQGRFGLFSYVNGNGAGTYDYVDESWGPPLDEGLCIQQWWAPGPLFTGDRPCKPWVSHPNNIRNYLQTGYLRQSNFSFATSGGGKNLRLSIGNMRQTGMLPGSELNQTTLALNGGADLSDVFRVNASVTYVKRDGENFPETGYDAGNPFLQFIWFGRQVSTQRLENYVEFADDGTPLQRNWNYSYHDNPYWIQKRNTSFQDRDRVFGTFSLAYDLAEWLTATAKVGTDWFNELRQNNWAVNSIGENPNGAFLAYDIFQQETNYQFLLNAEQQLTDVFSLSATAGAHHRVRDFLADETSVGQLANPGQIFTVQNAAVTPQVESFKSEEVVSSILGSAQLGYKNYAFLRVTGRNDWSSTLPADNRSYFYPSVSGSFIFTDAFGIQSDILSYGKIRASWARVGNDAQPYQLEAVFPATLKWGGITSYEVYDQIPNPGLVPEQTDEWEVGASLSLFGNRLGIDATYYDRRSYNQVITAEIPKSTGFDTQVLNGGEIHNWGVELLVNATPVIAGDFRWDLTVNFANNNSEVVRLARGLEAFILGGFGFWGVQAQARVGYPYGVFVGTSFLRNEDGEIVVGPSGYPVPGPREPLGKIDPDWTAGLGSRLSYGNFDFSFLFDTQQGGHVFSVTNMFGNYTGVLENTLKGRGPSGGCGNGIEFDEIHPESEPTANDACREIINVYHYLINEWDVYDASFVKLREVRLGWNVPTSLLGPLPISALDIALIGRNLWIHKQAPHIDPETAFGTDNRRGFEFGQIPTPRSIGFSISVTP